MGTSKMYFKKKNKFSKYLSFALGLHTSRLCGGRVNHSDKEVFEAGGSIPTINYFYKRVELSYYN